MSLPVCVKTWQHNVNQAVVSSGNALNDSRAVLLAIKNSLVGFASGAWIVRYSCDSVTAGAAGDGVDRWTVGTDLVWANAGTAHSWIVLRQAGISSSFEMLLDCSPANVSGSTIALVLSSAGFSGGSKTARPTAADECVVGQVPSGNTSARTYRVHVGHATDGSGTFFAVFSANVVYITAFIAKPANAVSGWSDPYIVYWSSQNMLSQIGVTSGTYFTAAYINGALCKTAITSEGAYNSTLAVNHTAPNDVSGEWELFPLGVYGYTPGKVGRHGSIVDMWAGSSGANTGDTYPATGTLYQFAQFGNLVVPWDGVSAPLLT